MKAFANAASTQVLFFRQQHIETGTAQWLCEVHFPGKGRVVSAELTHRTLLDLLEDRL